MVRVSNGLTRHRRHRKFVKLATGFRLGRKNVYKQVRLALVKQGQHAYEGRKEKKRDFRKLWIERLSAVIRSKGSRYSFFIKEMENKSIIINRKMLSNIAIVFPEIFDKIYDVVINDAKINQSITIKDSKVSKSSAPKAKEEAKEEKIEKEVKVKPAKTAEKKPAAKTVKPAVKATKTTKKAS